jgi:hypothetical protein
MLPFLGYHAEFQPKPANGSKRNGHFYMPKRGAFVGLGVKTQTQLSEHLALNGSQV